LLYQDYFALLGIAKKYFIDLNELKNNYLKLMQKTHPDNFVHATDSKQLEAIQDASLINEAYRTLLDPVQRAQYLLKLQGVDLNAETDTQMPLDFLMTQMALREELTELMGATNEDCQHLREKVHSAFYQCELELDKYLNPDNLKLDEARLCVRQMMFFDKLKSDVTKYQTEVLYEPSL